MEYVFTKRQIKMLGEGLHLQAAPPSSNGSLSDLPNAITKAVNSASNVTQVTAQAKDFNNTTSDPKKTQELTYTAQTGDVSNGVKNAIEDIKKDPSKMKGVRDGNTNVNMVLVKNGRYIPNDKLIEGRKFTKKQFDRFLKSLR